MYCRALSTRTDLEWERFCGCNRVGGQAVHRGKRYARLGGKVANRPLAVRQCELKGMVIHAHDHLPPEPDPDVLCMTMITLWQNNIVVGFATAAPERFCALPGSLLLPL
jgi:hypothetical protein